jgi:YggT family protein
MIPIDAYVNFDPTETTGLKELAQALSSVQTHQRVHHKMLTIIQILLLLISVVRFFVIAHFIMSWLIRFDVLNVRQEFVAQVWYGLQRILEPIYSRVRRFMPDLGGVDLSPIVVLVGLEILRIFLWNNAVAFG